MGGQWHFWFVVFNQCFSMVTLVQPYPTWRQLCPARTFCTSNTTQVIEAEGYESCCQSCSCDVDCHVVGNCCPDVDVPSTSIGESTFAPCTDLGALLNHDRVPEFNDTTRLYYRVISACPMSSGFLDEDVEERCTSPLQLQDYTLVSSRNGNKLYRNRHCARCNGEVDVVPWKMYTVNCDHLVQDVTSREYMDALILANCELRPQPTSYFYYRNVRCYHSEDETIIFIIKTCNYTRKWETYDAQLEKACTTTAPRKNDNYRIPGDNKLIDNIYCYLCNTASSEIAKHRICEELPLGIPRGGMRPPLTVLLQGDDEVRDRSIGLERDVKCVKSDQIYDSFFDTCRQLICSIAMVPSYGSCQPDGDTAGLGFTLNVAIHSTAVSSEAGGPSSPNITWIVNEAQEVTDAFDAHLKNGFIYGCATSTCHTKLNHAIVTGAFYFSSEFISLTTCPYHEMILKLSGLVGKNVEFDFETSSGWKRIMLTIDTKVYYDRSAIKRLAEVEYIKMCTRSPVLSRELLEVCPRIRISASELNTTLSNETISSLIDARIENEDVVGLDDWFTICLANYTAIMDSATQNAAQSVFKWPMVQLVLTTLVISLLM